MRAISPALAEARLRWVVDIDAPQGHALAAAYGARSPRRSTRCSPTPAVRVVVIGSSTDVARDPCARLCGVRARPCCARSPDRGQPRRGPRAALTPPAPPGRRRHRLQSPLRRASSGSATTACGRVRSARSKPCTSCRAVRNGPRRRRRRASSGGMLRDKGTHLYDLARWMAGSEPVEVYASGGCLFDPAYAEYGDVDSGGADAAVRLGRARDVQFQPPDHLRLRRDDRGVRLAGMLRSRAPAPLGVSLFRAARSSRMGFTRLDERFAPTYVARARRARGCVRSGTAVDTEPRRRSCARKRSPRRRRVAGAGAARRDRRRLARLNGLRTRSGAVPQSHERASLDERTAGQGAIVNGGARGIGPASRNASLPRGAAPRCGPEFRGVRRFGRGLCAGIAAKRWTAPIAPGSRGRSPTPKPPQRT